MNAHPTPAETTARTVEADAGPEPRRLRQLRSWLVFGAVVLAAWLVLGPTQLGGPASYVQVDGTSMEPTYSDGDLVLAKERASYDKGDVVTYVADVAGTDFPVIHRIVKVKTDGTYITQGDNRDEVDGFHVHDGNILGESWLRIPRAGMLPDLFRQPLGIALITAMAVLGMAPKHKRSTASRRQRE